MSYTKSQTLFVKGTNLVQGLTSSYARADGLCFPTVSQCATCAKVQIDLYKGANTHLIFYNFVQGLNKVQIT